MKSYDYVFERNKMIDAFEQGNFKTSADILEWFYKAKDFSSIFESVEVSSSIYKYLKENGYKELENKKEELEFINSLLSNELESREKVGYKLISLIMTFLRNHEDLDPSIILFINYYNEVFNSEKTFNKMMVSLRNHIGSEVVFLVNIKGENKLMTGTLDRVTDYKSITVNNENYPFIGYEVAILKIGTPTGETLYNNTRIDSKKPLTDFAEIEKINRETFGIEYDKTKNAKLYL